MKGSVVRECPAQKTHIGPLVSIGVPTYNRAADLRRCLNELTSQTYTNLEIIVSDNASPDLQVEQVLKDIVSDVRVTVVRQKTNIGPLSNFQFVLDAARGEYFLWAGDDDFRDPEYIEVLLAGFDKAPQAVMSFADFYECLSDGARFKGYPDHLPLLRGFESDRRWLRLLRYFLQGERLGKANMIYSLFRRETLRSHSWSSFVEQNGVWGADMLFVFQMLRKGPAVISSKRLYRCAVGNVKSYVPAVQVRGWRERIYLRYKYVSELLTYTLRYVALAPVPERVLFWAMWPLKMGDVLIRLFLREQILAIWSRIARGGRG